MNIRLDFVYWQLMFQLLQKNYSIIHMSNDQYEVWLQSTIDRYAPLVRLTRYDIDWSSWLQRDMEQAIVQANGWRRSQLQRKMNMINVYVTTYPPVDDWEFLVSRPVVYEQVTMHTIIISSENVHAMIERVGRLISQSFSLYVPEDCSMLDDELQLLKQRTLSFAEEVKRREKKIFERGKPLVTYVFIAIQLFMFFVLEWNGGSTNTLTLIEHGAKFNPLIVEGEWWRFFTPIFLHIGFLHLLMNTFALYYLGPLVEKLYGSFRFLLIYIASGFFGSLASFLFATSVSAGASGAIFGCFGALLYFGIVHPHLFFRTIGMNVLTVIGINLLFGFVVPNVDNAGHIGGLVGGLLIAAVVHFPRERFRFTQLLSSCAAIIVAVSGIYAGFTNPRIGDGKLALAVAQQYVEQQQYEKATELLALVDRFAPSLAEADLLQAYVFIQQRRYEEAKEALLKAIEKNENLSQAFYYLALLYAEEKNYIKAKQAIERAVQLDPNDPQYRKLFIELEKLF